MFIITSKQLEVLGRIKIEEFLLKVSSSIEEKFDKELITKRLKGENLIDFVRKNYLLAKNYRLTREDSIAGYILLSFLNGDNFLETKDFAVYKYYMTRKDYNPDVYIFNVPNLN
jgi:hypothetical protein